VIYSGRVLKDESLLSEYKIQSGHTIHMVKGAPRAPNPPPATQQIPSNLNAGQQIAGNPLAPLLNATNQIPGFNPFADLGISSVLVLLTLSLSYADQRTGFVIGTT
jgi:ubiquilin